MFKRGFKQQKMAAPYDYSSLRMIDEDAISIKARKDLFQELLEEGENRRSSPDSALPQLRNMVIEDGNHQGCKCSKIDCLKLYCECFAKGRVCNKNCICTGCQNCQGNQQEIHHAQRVANYRNPGHFKGVLAFVPGRKCTCKKSSCRKNYCECFRAGVKCGAECECIGCYNGNQYCHRQKRQDHWMQMESQISISSVA